MSSTRTEVKREKMQRFRAVRRLFRRWGRGSLTRRTAGLAVKRCADLLVASAFLCTLFPFVYVVVGLAVKCTSEGPVLFRQRRHGKDGRVFVCLKFRTMRVNAAADTMPSCADDPRVTPLGRFLRRTFIDELPQFVNVLRGDMSLIGPRPHMLDDTRRFSRDVGGYMRRLAVRPGITGLAQMLGFRGEVRTREDLVGRVRCDLWYIDHWSPRLDVYILLRSFREFISLVVQKV